MHFTRCSYLDAMIAFYLKESMMESNKGTVRRCETNKRQLRPALVFVKDEKRGKKGVTTEDGADVIVDEAVFPLVSTTLRPL
jgi:hypothetical protein